MSSLPLSSSSLSSASSSSSFSSRSSSRSDTTAANRSRTWRNECWYFAQGHCRNGATCRFLHTNQSDNPNVNSDSTRRSAEAATSSALRPFSVLIDKPFRHQHDMRNLILSAANELDMDDVILSLADKDKPNRCQRLMDILNCPFTVTAGCRADSYSFQRVILPLIHVLTQNTFLSSTLRHHTRRIYELIVSAVDDPQVRFMHRCIECSEKLTRDGQLIKEATPSNFLRLDELEDYLKPQRWQDVVVPLVKLLEGLMCGLTNFTGSHIQELKLWCSQLLQVAQRCNGDRKVESSVKRLLETVTRADTDQQRIRGQEQRQQDQKQRQMWSGSAILQGAAEQFDLDADLANLPGALRTGGLPRHDNDNANFREISIVPTEQEMLCSQDPFLPTWPPNLARQVYASNPVNAYLDAQFRLLREDALCQVRVGVSRFMSQGMLSVLPLDQTRVRCLDTGAAAEEKRLNEQFVSPSLHQRESIGLSSPAIPGLASSLLSTAAAPRNLPGIPWHSPRTFSRTGTVVMQVFRRVQVESIQSVRSAGMAFQLSFAQHPAVNGASEQEQAEFWEDGHGSKLLQVGSLVGVVMHAKYSRTGTATSDASGNVFSSSTVSGNKCPVKKIYKQKQKTKSKSMATSEQYSRADVAMDAPCNDLPQTASAPQYEAIVFAVVVERSAGRLCGERPSVLLQMLCSESCSILAKEINWKNSNDSGQHNPATTTVPTAFTAQTQAAVHNSQLIGSFPLSQGSSCSGGNSKTVCDESVVLQVRGHFFAGYESVLRTLQTLEPEQRFLRLIVDDLLHSTATATDAVKLNSSACASASEESCHQQSHWLLSPPAYADPSFEWNLDFLRNESKLPLRVKWSNAEELRQQLKNEVTAGQSLILDETQIDAFAIGLGRQLSLIQGPPGTGKTYVGVQIIHALLQNSVSFAQDDDLDSSSTFGGLHYCSRGRGRGRGAVPFRRRVAARRTNELSPALMPILCICFTNHALDAFLQALIEAKAVSLEDIVRGGSRSKSDALNSRNLQQLATKNNSAAESLCFHKLKDAAMILEKDITSLSSTLALSRKSEIAAALPSEWLQDAYPDHWDCMQALYEEDEDGFKIAITEKMPPLKYWLHLHDLRNGRGNKRTRESKHDECKDDDEEDQKYISLAEGSSHTPCGETVRSYDCLRSDSKVWKYSPAERSLVSQNWMEEYRKEKEGELQRRINQHQEVMQQLKELKAAEQLRVLRQAKVIAFTTSGCANFQTLLSALQPRVVMCEEAGEVLEAHIITALTPRSQHLILIGDHQQLRPKVQENSLSAENPCSKHKFDVSLFERLITTHGQRPPSGHHLGAREADTVQSRSPLWQQRSCGGINGGSTANSSVEIQNLPGTLSLGVSATLLTQRRMHSSIADILRATIYPKLQDFTKVVEHYPVLRGFQQNTFNELGQPRGIPGSEDRSVSHESDSPSASASSSSMSMFPSTLSMSASDSVVPPDLASMAGTRQSRVWFFDHDAPDSGARRAASTVSDAGNGVLSYSNTFEADMIMHLLKYLIRHGYDQHDIAVLTPYVGQLLLLRTRLKQRMHIYTELSEQDQELLEKEEDVEHMDIANTTEATDNPSESLSSSQTHNNDHTDRKSGDIKRLSSKTGAMVCASTSLGARVRLATVDNFQGEEANIIILSTVRCNSDGRTGFLRFDNRVNVMLSRAKHAMFVFGSRSTVLRSRKAKMFNSFIRQMEQRNTIGRFITLKCFSHSTVTVISSPQQFEAHSEDGGCLKLCLFRLACGHNCQRMCHPDDAQHIGSHATCKQRCVRLLQCNHACESICSLRPCPPCQQPVQLPLPCGHRKVVLCHQYAAEKTPATVLRCYEQVQITSPMCGHTLFVACFEATEVAIMSSERSESVCSIATGNMSAENSKVEHRLPSATHGMIAAATNRNHPIFRCKANCGKSREECGHSCQSSCGACWYATLGKWKAELSSLPANSHHVSALPTAVLIHSTNCQKQCGRQLVCGHLCSSECHAPSPCGPCQQRCQAACIHSTCPRSCAEVCAACAMPCAWTHTCRRSLPTLSDVVHSHLSEKKVQDEELLFDGMSDVCPLPCAAPCTRLPCDLRCARHLKCGHRCPALCGESCPSTAYCRECAADSEQKMHLTVDMVEMTTLKDNDCDANPIIVLVCGHAFTATTLDGICELHKYYEYSETEARWTGTRPLAGISGTSGLVLRCPECRAPIRSVYRYGRILNRLALAMLQRKFKIYVDNICAKTTEELSAHQSIINAQKNQRNAQTSADISLQQLGSISSCSATDHGSDWNVSAQRKALSPPRRFSVRQCVQLRNQLHALRRKVDRLLHECKTSSPVHEVYQKQRVYYLRAQEAISNLQCPPQQSSSFAVSSSPPHSTSAFSSSSASASLSFSANDLYTSFLPRQRSLPHSKAVTSAAPLLIPPSPEPLLQALRLRLLLTVSAIEWRAWVESTMLDELHDYRPQKYDSTKEKNYRKERRNRGASTQESKHDAVEAVQSGSDNSPAEAGAEAEASLSDLPGKYAEAILHDCQRLPREAREWEEECLESKSHSTLQQARFLRVTACVTIIEALAEFLKAARCRPKERMESVRSAYIDEGKTLVQNLASCYGSDDKCAESLCNLAAELNRVSMPWDGVFYGAVSAAEKRMIYAVMSRDVGVGAGSFGGHWYECPNGHIYCIGECGGAMQNSKCPECGEEVGGSQHRLLGTNRVANTFLEEVNATQQIQQDDWRQQADVNLYIPR